MQKITYKAKGDNIFLNLIASLPIDQKTDDVKQGRTMSGLDSLYAMLARPATTSIKLQRKVVQASHSTEMAEDSHEAPQSQLPPKSIPQKSERRKTANDKYVRAYDRRQQRKKKLATPTGASIDIQI
jgi:hypothetical protein